MAKNLATIEQTQQGIEVRHYLLELEQTKRQELLNLLHRANQYCETLRERNSQNSSITLSGNEITLPAIEISYLIQGIRCYQDAFYKLKETLNMPWIDHTIEDIKRKAGFSFCDV